MSTELSDLPVSVWEPVTSSQIEAVKYIPSMLVLFVRFPGGAVYRYDQVEPSVYSGFMASESKGSYFGKHIKSSFKFHKVESAEPAEIVSVPEPVKIGDIKDLMPKIDPVVIRANELMISSHSDAELASAERLVVKARIYLDRV